MADKVITKKKRRIKPAKQEVVKKKPIKAAKQVIRIIAEAIRCVSWMHEYSY